MSCQAVYAVFRCCDSHKTDDNPEGLIFKHIARCQTCVNNGTICPRNQQEVAHIIQEDDEDKDCPVCRGETPPETPPETP